MGQPALQLAVRHEGVMPAMRRERSVHDHLQHAWAARSQNSVNLLIGVRTACLPPCRAFPPFPLHLIERLCFLLFRTVAELPRMQEMAGLMLREMPRFRRLAPPRVASQPGSSGAAARSGWKLTLTRAPATLACPRRTGSGSVPLGITLRFPFAERCLLSGCMSYFSTLDGVTL